MNISSVLCVHHFDNYAKLNTIETEGALKKILPVIRGIKRLNPSETKTQFSSPEAYVRWYDDDKRNKR
jgi:hypothetical protein